MDNDVVTLDYPPCNCDVGPKPATHGLLPFIRLEDLKESIDTKRSNISLISVVVLTAHQAEGVGFDVNLRFA